MYSSSSCPETHSISEFTQTVFWATPIDVHLPYRGHQAWVGLNNVILTTCSFPHPCWQSGSRSLLSMPWICTTPLVSLFTPAWKWKTSALLQIRLFITAFKCAMEILYWGLFYLSNGMSVQIRAGYKAVYLLEVWLLGCELQLRDTHPSGNSFEKELRFEATLW